MAHSILIWLTRLGILQRRIPARASAGSKQHPDRFLARMPFSDTRR